MAAKIHPTAIVDSKAELADDVTIGPFCTIEAGAVIGEGTVLRSHISVTGRVHIGIHNDIYPFCVLGAEPQDHSYKGSPTLVEIGDHNILREAVQIHRATEKEDGVTRLGSHCYLMGNAHMAHDVKVGSHVTISNNCLLAGHVHVHDYAILSGMIGVHHFTTIGSYSFIGGCSRVVRDIPPYMLVEGNPSVIHCVNLVGLRRQGIPNDEIRSLMEAHRLMFRAKLPVSKAREMLEGQGCSSNHVRKLFEFIENQNCGRNGRGRERRKAA